MNHLFAKKWILLIPGLFCALGVFFSFRFFWNGFDLITGDWNDSRFNLVLLEHTWLWLNGAHPSLFDMPMFYPHANTYAYSDYLMGYAPIYWFFRQFSFDEYHSFQFWLVSCGILNFGVYFYLAKRFFSLSPFWASLAAFVFSFSALRTGHLYHVQTYPQFFIAISAVGALLWNEKPNSKFAPWLFFLGAMLQLISAFYYLWFWVLTLWVLLIWAVLQPERRRILASKISQIHLLHFSFAGLISALAAAPFLTHYLINSRELGRHGWPAISETVPRLYSWLFVAKDHWEWPGVPFKDWINQLAMPQEQNLSPGFFTLVTGVLSIHWILKNRKELLFLIIPIIGIFFLTLTSGRFSTWVLISYLFPGGGVIRAVGRIQIFLLAFWSIPLTLYLTDLLNRKSSLRRGFGVLLVLGCLSDSFYTNSKIYSRGIGMERVQYVSDQIPTGCTLVAASRGFGPSQEALNLDVTLAAFKKGIPTLNGYSGHNPQGFFETLSLIPEQVRGKHICFVNGFREGT